MADRPIPIPRVALRRAQPGDVTGLFPLVRRPPCTPDQLRLAMTQARLTIAVEVDGSVRAIACVLDHGDGSAAVTAIVGDVPRRAWPAIRREAADWLRQWQNERGTFRRIEATTLTARPQHANFLRGLGFAREGTMRAAGPDGADYDLHARVVLQRETFP